MRPVKPRLRACASSARRGVAIALDDVTTVAQLEAVREWPLDTVKLGREITGHAVADQKAAETAYAIAQLARERNIALVAVGVEDRRR